MKKNEILKEYYEKGGEKERLTKDKSHQVEFLTTTRYIDKYLKKDDKIIEIGAGTGIYSLHYAQRGYFVEAVELIQYNIDVLKEQVTSSMNINVRQGDAIDLSFYEDNSFDITLVLGPLYHLYNEEDKEKAISEAIRVTKKNGLIFIAYLTHGSIVLGYGLKKGNMLDLKRQCDEQYRFVDDVVEVFSAFFVDEFEKMMEKFNCEHVASVGADGITNSMGEWINQLTDEEYDVWLDYHYKSCERKDIQGYSCHMLHICRKN